MLWALEKQMGCPDVLGVWATDSDLHGVGFSMPSPALISLTQHARARWQRIAVHVEAGHRLRRRLGCAPELGTIPAHKLLLEANAVIDPKRFVLTHASGPARDRDTKEALREAAIRVDKARSKLRKQEGEQALEVWQGLVRGRWSLVDWFDSDGRRFIVVIPNAPGLGDPRGLTEREHQVATYVARGESGKLIGYRFGISRQRVSLLLKSAMRKLGVKTQAELVVRMRGFERSDDAK
jgi:DNA-binding CsgD family transcriptional regulator